MKTSLSGRLRIALVAAILCVTSQWAVPVGAVPMTPATLFVALAGALLGPWQGVLSILVYLLIGACGLPVFSGFRGGLSVFVGPTGGYLWGYLFLAFGAGLMGGKKIWLQILTGLAGMVIMYGIGTIQLMAVANLELQPALAAAVYPFVLKDVLCVALGVFLGRSIKRRLKHA